MLENNYKIIEQQLKNYSSEILENNSGPLELLKELQSKSPNMIVNAKNLNLLASAITYLYLKRNNLNGRGGITAKSVGEYFGVKPANITHKTFDVGVTLYGLEEYENKPKFFEYIDKDRFEVNELYWSFLDSKDAEDIKKSIQQLKKIIKQDPDYFDPYITLYEYYLGDNNSKKAIDTMNTMIQRVMNLVFKKKRFPDRLILRIASKPATYRGSIRPLD